MSDRRPGILVIGGIDPAGAGLLADIETCFAHGCQAFPIATSLTVQNTASLQRVVPVDPRLIEDQLTHLLADCAPPLACKIGLVPTPEIAHVLESFMRCRAPDFPVILDPVLDASSGARLVAPDMERELLRRLVPSVTLLKPNLSEAHRLVGAAYDHESLGRILSTGPGRCRYALLTGSDVPGAIDATHDLFRDGKRFARFSFPLRAGRFHGTGCTLTTAIACMLGWGASCEVAVGAALDFTWRAVRDAQLTGSAQSIPNRSSGLAGLRTWP